MIRIGDTEIDLSDPLVLLGLAAVGLIFAMLVLLIVIVRRAGQSGEMIAPIAQTLDQLTTLSHQPA